MLRQILRGHGSARFPMLSACCVVEIDTSIICHVLVHCFGSFLLQVTMYMIQQACKCVSLSLWPCLTFCELKVTYMLKSSGLGLERVSCHGNRIFIAVGVFPVELLAYQVSMVCAANCPR